MKSSGEAKLLAIMGLFVLLGGAALFFMKPGGTRPTPAPTPPPQWTAEHFDSLLKDAPHVEGDPNAALTIVEFADFQCPSCRRAYRDIIAKRANFVPFRLIFRHFPLPSVHERAIPAAIASEAASKQGKFWPMYNALFTGEKTELTDEFIDAQAKKIGLDMPKFAADRKSPELKQLVEDGPKFATSNGISQTPTFVVREKTGKITELVGGPDLEDFLLRLAGKTPAPRSSPATAAPNAPTAP